MDSSSVENKRSEFRQAIEDNQAYIEITLTYPHEHSICRPILDFSSTGVSFSIPVDEGFLLPGTPIKKLVIHTKSSSDNNLAGKVCHLSHFVNENGEAFTKVGLQLTKPFGNGLGQRGKRPHPVRPHRYKEKDFKKWVRIQLLENGGKEIDGKLINFSKFGLAFEIDDVSNSLMNSVVLPSTKVFFEGEVIYDGPTTVRSIRNLNGKLVIGASVVDKLINISKVRNLRSKTNHRISFQYLLSGLAYTHKVPSEVKAVVSDMRLFLDGVKFWLNKDDNNDYWAYGSKNSEIRLQSFLSEFGESFNNHHERLQEVVNGLDSNIHEMCKRYYQKHLHELLLMSPLLRRIYAKPCGYAGDYLTVNMLLGEPFIGDNLFAKLISWYIWQVLPAQAHRNRMKYLVEMIKEQVLKSRRSYDEHINILNLGSGPAIEIQNCIKEFPELCRCNISLVDFDSEALSYSQDKLLDLSIQYLLSSISLMPPFLFGFCLSPKKKNKVGRC